MHKTYEPILADDRHMTEICGAIMTYSLSDDF